MRLRNIIAASVISVSAAAGLAAPAYAAAPLKADACSLHVSIAHPHARQEETLTAATTAGGTTVRVRIRYKTVSHLWTFTTAAASARASRTFGVGRPSPGWKVTLAGAVTAAPEGYRTGAVCATSFTPR
jgi:hypothetical protein